MSASRKKTLPAATKREVAVRAKVDPRSVDRVLRGQAVQPRVVAEVTRVLQELGFGHLQTPPIAESTPTTFAAPESASSSTVEPTVSQVSAPQAAAGGGGGVSSPPLPPHKTSQ